MSEYDGAGRARGTKPSVTLAVAIVMAAAGWCGCAGRTAASEPAAVEESASDVPTADGGAVADGGTVAAADPLTCEALEREFYAERRDVAEHAPRTCSDAADCQVVELGDSCFAGCGYRAGIASSGAEALRLSVTALAERSCSSADTQGCQYVPLPCVPPSPATADCVGGLCSAVYGK